ncbi:hypothetical protein TYRP_013921, partial [Tyrophagus putrescentiae]
FGQRLTLTTLGHCERPPTRAPLAPLARPESVDVHSAQVSSDLAALVKQRLTLASLGSPKTPADSDLASGASEALVGGRFCGAPPAAQGENGSDNAQPKSQDFVSKAE